MGRLLEDRLKLVPPGFCWDWGESTVLRELSDVMKVFEYTIQRQVSS